MFGDGEQNQPFEAQQTNPIDDDLLHYLLSKSLCLYQKEKESAEDYADFVIGLVQNLREIDASRADLEKIINLVMDPKSACKEKQSQESLVS